jgi:tetratricopeptide (TPR) repeat protein
MADGRRREIYLVLGAFALRLLWILDLSRLPFFDLPTSDSLFYAQQAARIVEGQLVGTDLSYPSSPLYPYLLAPFFLLPGKAVFWATYLVQAALDSTSALLLKRTGTTLFGSAAGWLAGVAWAVYGLAVFYSGDLMEATAAAFFANLFLYLYIGRHRSSPAADLAAGICLGLASLLRPHFLPLCALAALALLCLRQPAARRASLAAFTAGLVLPLSLSLARNVAVSGEAVLISPYSGLNAYLGNHRNAPGYLRFPTGRGLRNNVDLRQAAHAYPEAIAGRPLSEPEVSRFWWAETGREITAAPLEWSGLMFRKARLFWASYEAPNHLDFYFFRSASLPLAAAVIPFGFFGPLGLAGVALILGRGLRRRAGRPSRETLFLATATLAYAGICSAFFIGDRFRLPISGWIAVLAGATLAALIRDLKRGRFLPSGLLAAFVALLSGALLVPPPESHGAREHVMVAASLAGRGRLEEAERLLHRAVDLEPGSAVARFNLGLHLLRRDRPRRALVEMREATRLAPEFAAAHGILGDLILRLDPGAIEDARRHYRTALRIEPYGTDARRLEAALASMNGSPSPP